MSASGDINDLGNISSNDIYDIDGTNGIAQAHEFSFLQTGDTNSETSEENIDLVSTTDVNSYGKIPEGTEPVTLTSEVANDGSDNEAPNFSDTLSQSTIVKNPSTDTRETLNDIEISYPDFFNMAYNEPGVLDQSIPSAHSESS